MNLISLENISKSYSEKILIDNISFGINDGDKIGLIGVNGTGKSTLLKIIAGSEEFFEGNIIKMRDLRIEYLSQDPQFKSGETILDAIFSGDTKEMQVLSEYEDLLKKIENGDETLHDRLIKVQAEMDSMNLWDLEREAKTILTKLGIDDFNLVVDVLSGGQIKRIALAAALIRPCDLLILDEPTNHLDSDAIEWLEEYLNNRKGSVFMITHDRYFLDNVSNRIVELDKGNLYQYKGNYSHFLEAKIEREASEKSTELKRQNFLRNELKWVKRGAKARTTKQKARLDRFNEVSSVKYVDENNEVEFDVKGSRLGRKLIEINNVSKSFETKNILNNFSYTLLKEDRIGIVGNNGVGKSTLMKLLVGEETIDSGEIILGTTTKIGFFTQQNDSMDDQLRVIDYIREAGEWLETQSGERIMASKMLEKFLFKPETHYTQIKKLSGGEKRRLYLLRILMSAPNILLLDEPTNDLDTITLGILEEYLDSFNGPIITVSHDRYFLDRICNKILYMEGDASVQLIHGAYEEFAQYKESLREKVEVVKEKKEKVSGNRELKFSYKEKIEYENIEDEIENLELKIEELEGQIEVNASNYSKLTELMEEKSKMEEELESKYERWEYLNDLAKRIEESKQ